MVGQGAKAVGGFVAGFINGFGDSFIKPWGGRMNGGPINGNEGAFSSGDTVGKWTGFVAQAALFVAGVVGLAFTVPALVAAGGGVALAGAGVLATGAALAAVGAAAVPVAASGAVAIGGLYMAMSSVQNLGNQGGGGGGAPNAGRPNPVTSTPRSAPSFKPDPKNNVTAQPRTVNQFLADAEKFLGKGYSTGKDGALYSADGSRRVRFSPSDLAGHNGGPPHGHFEFNGRRNIHIPLTDK